MARRSSWATTAATSTRWRSAISWPSRGRTVRFLGKKEVFDAPVVGDAGAALGGIRVDRGTGSDEPLQAAEDALAAGEMVALMPQGTIPRGPAFFDPILKGRWGAMKLAHATGAPVIPVGIWGTETVWPRSAKVPNVTNVLSPPTVRIRVGEPVQIGGRRPRCRHRGDDVRHRPTCSRRRPVNRTPRPRRSWRRPIPRAASPTTSTRPRHTRATVAPAPTDTN